MDKKIPRKWQGAFYIFYTQLIQFVWVAAKHINFIILSFTKKISILVRPKFTWANWTGWFQSFWHPVQSSGAYSFPIRNLCILILKDEWAFTTLSFPSGYFVRKINPKNGNVGIMVKCKFAKPFFVVCVKGFSMMIQDSVTLSPSHLF